MPRRCKCGCRTEIKPASKCTTHMEKRGYSSEECQGKAAIEALGKIRAKNTRKANADKKKAEKAVRSKHREDKDALKTKPQLTKLTQPKFNKFIRLRDFDDGCISCNRTKEEVESQDMLLSGGYWDCGHFISVGANETLRFEEFNAHKQCKSCNGGSGKYAKKNATVATQYRVNLIEKIGLGKVEWLEGPHKTNNYTHDEIRAIGKKYAKKARELEKLLTV